MIVRQILSHTPNVVTTIELRGRVHSVNGDLIDNVTALWCALDRAHFTVARTLIDVGKANVNHGPRHPLLIDAVIRGRLDIVRFLIDNDYADVNQTKTNDEYGCNSLIVSVTYGHTSVVEYLIGKNAELESKTSVDGNTALAVAATKGNLESVRLLCMSGASLTTKTHTDKTPLRLAAENGHFNVMEYLLEQNHHDAIFNDLEFAVASHILTYKDTSNYKSEWAIELLRYLLAKRIQFNVPKTVVEPTNLYDCQRECQTNDEFNQIQNNDDRLYVEALLINERILLAEKDNRALAWLFDRAMTLVEKNQFEQCLDLVLHIYCLSERGEFQPSLKPYFWILYTMFKSNTPVPEHRFWEICDLIFKSSIPNIDGSHERDKSYLLELGSKIDFPDISTVLREMNLNYSDVANIYCHGSWVQGTCTPTSDRDLIIVTYSQQHPLNFWEDFDYFHEFELHNLTDGEKTQARRDFIFKNLFHGIRFLDLAEQLIPTRSMYDLTRVSYILDIMKDIRGDPTDEAALDRVLDFVRIKSTEIKTRLDTLVPREPIRGIFKVYITFECRSNFPQMLKELKNKCHNTKYQLAIIQADTNTKKDTFPQLIAIRSYHGEYPSIGGLIENEVNGDFAEFDIARMIIKSSVSNQGVPSSDIDKQLFWDEQTHCFELHYHLLPNQSHVELSFYRIIDSRKRRLALESSCSSYTMRRIDLNRSQRILKMSFFDIGRKTALEMNDEIMNTLKQYSYPSSKIEPEFVVYDTNIDSMKIVDS
ncbi:unnamed protein product [Rotaria sordida]|uniref:Polymerase nucleotidyl transferase domain-containing protein n=1 Tax=Rotaria sordida TaxID=392033 RepID=A0A815FCL7_9BILA|nr:unnamed protein product [Rotaria sordida]